MLRILHRVRSFLYFRYADFFRFVKKFNTFTGIYLENSRLMCY